MRKSILIAFVLFIGITVTQAQVRISPGLKGGLNLSRLTNIDGNGLKSDFYVGGFMAIKFNKFFTLQPELTYSKQGSEGRYYDFNDNYYDTKYDLNYLSLDAVAKFHFNRSGFHILAGPSVDFKIGDNFGDYGFDDPVDFDISIIGGVGYTLPNGLTFEARIKQGLIDIYGYDNTYDNNGNGNYDEVILNQAIQVGISYTFKMK
ncbi:PorT family protein [Flavobacterium cheongpyeongense]|uniref:PorT family protein n=1 Tax=Flavobacterium cheongpyeongense TaxID=2212651 RepID=A0A2V4BLF1_9FLAO|nr:porin family protein [Flavobacterium cheongpyeongense]PXY39671.1 PorT family protein [Flavobacterium cheongpyeongense]